MDTTNTQDTNTEELIPLVRLLKEYGQEREYKLSSPEDVAYVEKMVDELVEYGQTEWLEDMIPDIVELMHGDLQNLAQTDPELYARVENMTAKAQWLILNTCTPDEIEELFVKHFDHFFEYDWKDVDEKTRVVLLTIQKRDQRDAMKKRWREAIESSQATISDDQLTVNGQTVDSTVENWIKDFRLFLGDRDIDPLVIIEYLGNAENPGAVSEETRKKVQGVLEYVEILHRSSMEANGAEEKFLFSDPASGTYKLFDRGEVRDTEVEIPKEDLEQLRYAYNLDENGNPRSFAQQVQTSPLFTETDESRYAAPPGSVDVSSTVTPPEMPTEPTEVVPLMDQEVEPTAAPEAKSASA